MKVAAALIARRKEETESGSCLSQHRVVAISTLLRSGDQTPGLSVGAGDSRRTTCCAVLRGIDSSGTLVSWNGSGFDLPVLHYRMLRHGIASPTTGLGERDRDFNGKLLPLSHAARRPQDVLSLTGARSRSLEHVALLLDQRASRHEREQVFEYWRAGGSPDPLVLRDELQHLSRLAPFELIRSADPAEYESEIARPAAGSENDGIALAAVCRCLDRRLKPAPRRDREIERGTEGRGVARVAARPYHRRRTGGESVRFGASAGGAGTTLRKSSKFACGTRSGDAALPAFGVCGGFRCPHLDQPRASAKGASWPKSSQHRQSASERWLPPLAGPSVVSAAREAWCQVRRRRRRARRIRERGSPLLADPGVARCSPRRSETDRGTCGAIQGLELRRRVQDRSPARECHVCMARAGQPARGRSGGTQGI